MNVWRLNINPDSDDDVDPRSFCFENQVLGFGWPIDTDASTVSWEEYKAAASQKYGKGGSWGTAVRALHDRMNESDLCWARDLNGTYYLARVEGPWRYDARTPNLRADIVNVRDCQWVEAGDVDVVPGKVVNSLSISRTLQRVTGDTIEAYSKALFNLRNERSVYDTETGTTDLFTLIHSEDCEDLIGLYLQEKGYRLIPSTCKKSTVKYEYVCKHRETGEKAFAQVKRGHVPLDAADYKHLDGTVYLFTTHGDQRGAATNVHFIEPREVKQFAFNHKSMLPDRIQAWLEVIDA